MPDQYVKLVVHVSDEMVMNGLPVQVVEVKLIAKLKRRRDWVASPVCKVTVHEDNSSV